MPHHVVAGAIVGPTGVLLVHRRSDRLYHPDCWDLPGGHVEPGEDPADALARELREELGVMATITGPAHSRYREDENSPNGLDLRVWIVSAWSGDPRNLAADEHDELRWVGPGEWASMTLAHVSVGDVLVELLP